jgi:hypothetical protein
MVQGRNITEEIRMANTPQNPKPQQAQKSEYSNQSHAGKVGDNIRKDEPTAQKPTGAMKDDVTPAKPSKAS